MKEPLKLKVLNLINSTGKVGIKLNGITRKFNSTNSKNIEKILKYYLNTGQILQKNNKFFSSQKLNLIRAQITRNFKNYCFAKAIDAQCDYFIPSKFSKNALLNDFVLISKLPKKFIKATSNKSKEGQVVAFIKKENTKFTGTIKLINNIFYVLPDEYFNTLFSIANESQNLKENYKVIATIDRKYFNLSKPFCKIIKIYGDANIADLCALAYLKKNNISLNFKKTILEEAKKLKQSYKKEQFERLDLTKKITFTIDGKNSKDLDDAISIEKFHDFYLVGVHIADVSNFVKFKSKIDVQALKRANSIYFANRVIPMLCEILSNELCSLKSNRIRLTFSVLMKINFEGKIINFKIQKTKIKSKIKGVYEEINQIFENNYTKNKKTALLKKYNKILPQLEILKELCSTLKAKRIKNGTPNLQSNECEIKLDKNNKVTNIIAKKQLIAENIIEELMLMANVCVAKFAKKHKLPIFFRIHEKPTQEKINNFKNLLQNLNINSSQMKPNVKVKTFATLLEKYKNSSKFSIINNNILRTMSSSIVARLFCRPS